MRRVLSRLSWRSSGNGGRRPVLRAEAIPDLAPGSRADGRARAGHARERAGPRAVRHVAAGLAAKEGFSAASGRDGARRRKVRSGRAGPAQFSCPSDRCRDQSGPRGPDPGRIADRSHAASDRGAESACCVARAGRPAAFARFSQPDDGVKPAYEPRTAADPDRRSSA